MKQISKNRTGSGLVIFAISGALIAGGIFFATFILSSRAATPNKYAGLQLVVPTPPTLDPLPTPILSSPVIVPSPILEEIIEEPISSESAEASLDL